MILSGDAVDASKAKALGIIDEVIEGDLLDAALGYVRRLLLAGAPRRRLSAQTCAVPDGFSFAARRAKALKDAGAAAVTLAENSRSGQGSAGARDGLRRRDRGGDDGQRDCDRAGECGNTR